MPSTRDSLLASIETLHADAQKLTGNTIEDEPHRQSIRNQISRLKNDTATPYERAWEIFFQPHQSAAVKVALEGKWFEVLADEKPKTAQEIASVTGAEHQLIIRIMMVLTATDVVGEVRSQTYVATPITQLFLTPGWANGLRHFFDHCGPSLINLPGYLERNGYRVPQDVKTGPFADAWGGKNTWALYEAEPARGDVFNSFMTRWKDGETQIWTDTYPAKTSLCDQIEKSKEAVLLIDIGGGSGHVLKSFAEDSAHRTGRLILQDLPAALGNADELRKQGIEAMAHDIFTPQPIKGAKAYYFRHILHDWPDRACHEILSNTAQAMRKGYSKLLLDELVLPDTEVPPQGALLDLSMMALETGAERTAMQWHELLKSAGLRIEKIWHSKVGLDSVIEAALAL